MGMMNILMQLRKVCNHPDLFEPRSIVTPFVLDTIAIPMACCIPEAIAPVSFFERISDNVLCPLWSGGTSDPSFTNAVRHDSIESNELLELEGCHSTPPLVRGADLEEYDSVSKPLRELIDDLFKTRNCSKLETKEFLNSLNRKRCRNTPFSYPTLLLKTLQFKEQGLRPAGMETPQHLLAMKKDQFELSREANAMVKRFVFCVPKAASMQQPSMIAKGSQRSKWKNKSLADMLIEPVQEMLRPFREASARLCSDFPDKKLVQFDSGKLQTLAELLRERKIGGHKVLIFTQMGKMVRILH